MPYPRSGGLVGVIRKLLPYTTAATVIAVLYVVWVFFSRWNENRHIERAAEAPKTEASGEFAKTYESGLKILNFYVTPGVVARGQKALICYGVANAKTVSLDPAVERVWPSVNRCFEVAPVRETRYTLTAQGDHGETKTESLVVKVR